jgi:hypothetical protein
LTDFLLTFVVPSGIARVVIMASIALALAEAFKLGSRKQRIARHVPYPQLHGQYLRQDDHRRCGLNHRAGLIEKVGGSKWCGAIGSSLSCPAASSPVPFYWPLIGLK